MDHEIFLIFENFQLSVWYVYEHNYVFMFNYRIINISTLRGIAFGSLFAIVKPEQVCDSCVYMHCCSWISQCVYYTVNYNFKSSLLFPKTTGMYTNHRIDRDGHWHWSLWSSFQNQKIFTLNIKGYKEIISLVLLNLYFISINQLQWNLWVM